MADSLLAPKAPAREWGVRSVMWPKPPSAESLNPCCAEGGERTAGGLEQLRRAQWLPLYLPDEAFGGTVCSFPIFIAQGWVQT